MMGLEAVYKCLAKPCFSRWAVALVPALYEEHYLASVLVRLSGVVDGVVVCDDGSVDLMRSGEA